MLSAYLPFKPAEPVMQISWSKCPMFRRIALFIVFFMWSEEMMLKLPVEETKMSTSDMTPSGQPVLNRVVTLTKVVLSLGVHGCQRGI